ncbi:MAG: class I tRNA ligase family protein, partial [Emcibacter sp.]|nr:class I tRNA ligase family protein [Emcibacter sp.]
IQDWCISRQLWWGHQIPAWYGPDGEIFVSMTEEEAQTQANKHYGEEKKLIRDPDVLDTWFSSALWPFGTLGWPDDTPELKKHYKTDVLITGFDIIFFWVARMMMDGIHFMDEVPFHTVYVHALVRDEHGAKMSKSKGNVINPLDLVDKFGADALRFTLASMEAQGRDIKMSEKRVEGYRNFGTKLWNAARFCDMNGCFDNLDPAFDPANVHLAVNKWIIGEVVKATGDVTKALEAFRYNDATAAIYHFTWGTFCDWYVELIKPQFFGEDEQAKVETRNTAAWVMDQILKSLHPFMPFITEEIWGSLRDDRETDLIISDWPTLDSALIDDTASQEMNWVIQLVSDIRTARAEMNVPAGAKLDMLVQGATADTQKALEAQANVIKRLARLETINMHEGDAPKGAVQVVVGEATYFLPLSGIIDIAAEKARLNKSLDKLAKEIGGISGRLNNEAFMAKAPDNVVAENRKNLELAEQKAAKIKEGISRLDAMD